MSDWERAAVDMLTEVSMLEPIIKSLVTRLKPESLGEAPLSALVMASRVGPVGATRSALNFSFERYGNSLGDALDELAASGALDRTAGSTPDDDLFRITDKGTAVLDDALRALIPAFEPAMRDIPVARMDETMELLREIRRTLDNLPE